MNSKRFSRDDIIAAREDQRHRDAREDCRREESYVDFLLKRLKMTKKRNTILGMARERTGSPMLTLDLFCEMVPNFPILLGCASVSKVNKLHADNRCTLPALIKHFQDAPFVPAYEELYNEAESRAAGRAIGLLFRRKGIDHGFIMHDNEGLADYWYHGTKVTHHCGTREDPKMLVVESFVSLVEAIYNSGHGWKPDFAF